MSERLPPRIYLGQMENTTVRHATMDGNDYLGEGERLLRFVVPPFQRPAVWSVKQQQKFMESLILGLPVGAYTYHQSVKMPRTDGWLIDGQQRMMAIRDYRADAFIVFGWLWSELPLVDQRRVQGMSFPAYVLNDLDEKELLERYITLNYSGTPHTEADQAKAKRRLRTLKAVPTVEGK